MPVALDPGAIQFVSSTTRVPAAAASRPHFLTRAPARVLRTVRRELSTWQQAQELRPILEKIRPYSMVPEFSLIHLAGVINNVVAERLPGNVVGAGTAASGTSFLMGRVMRRAGVDGKRVFLCVCFEGPRPPENIDGQAAL